MSDIIPSDKKEYKTSNLLHLTLMNLAEGLTGIAASSKKDYALSIGHILQRYRSGNFLRILMQEWNKYKEKGWIKEDYEQTEQHQTCLQEMLDFLDNDLPDKTRFEFMKKIFLVASTEETLDRESILPQQYMRICRGLKSGEILVLAGAYQMVKQESWDSNDMLAENWLENIAGISGLEHNDLVSVYEKKLIDNGLITPRTHSDRSGVIPGKYYRLTPLGYELCRFVEAYDDLKEEKEEADV